jgi:mercuric reductase
VIINSGLPIGGTCVNVGCVPSKTLLRAADALHRATRNPFKGIELKGKLTDFRAVIAQKREMVEALRETKYLDVVKDSSNIKIVEGRGKLIDSKTVSVDGENYQAERIIIATGSSPYLPPVKGLAESGYLTSESLFELDELPESAIVLGGRYIALECAQMLARFGTRVTMLQRSPRIIPNEAEDVSHTLAGYLESEGIKIVTGMNIEFVERDTDGVKVTAKVGGKTQTFRAARLLAAMGRRANTEEIGLESAGIETRRDGSLEVDNELRSSRNGIYGAGDVIGEPMFVYTAAYEGGLAAENAVNNSAKKRDYSTLPWVIFTDPQVAGVGMDEKQAEEAGIEADSSTLPLTQLPRALAARDTRGFVKLIREVKTDKLVGARVVAPEGSEMIMEAALAVKYGITATELAGTFHPYLTLSEAIKLAAIGFKKDVKKLSCCAT